MRKVLLILVIALMLLPIVNAAQDVQYTEETAPTLEILFLKQDVFKAGTNLVFGFHVFNLTGFIVDNTTVECELHVYNQTGAHVISEKNISFSVADTEWEYEINDSTFLEAGEYSYFVQCNDSDNAGFASAGFDITDQGVNLQQSEFVMVGIFIIAFLFMSMAFKLDSGILKTLFFFLAMLSITIGSYVLTVLTSYVQVKGAADILYIISATVTIFTFIFTIIMLIYKFLIGKDVEGRREQEE